MIRLASELSTFLLLTSLTVMILSAVFAIGTLYLETGKLYLTLNKQPPQIIIKDFIIEENSLKILVYNSGTSSLIFRQDDLNIHVIFYGNNSAEYKVYRSWTVYGKKLNAFELLPANEVELETRLETLPNEGSLINIIITSGESRVEWSKRI